MGACAVPETHTFNLDGLELDLPVVWETEDDDDGCGEPEQTGNAMTGKRGNKRVAYITSAYGQKNEIIKKILEHIEDQLAELVEDDE